MLANLSLFTAHRGFPGEGTVACPLMAVRQGVEDWIDKFGLSESSPDGLFRQLGAWSLDTGSDAPATARVQDRPHKWKALLGDTFPAKVSQYGLALNVERQPYQVHRPRQLPLLQAGPAEEPQVLRGSKGYVRKVYLDYETQLFAATTRRVD